MTRIFIFILTVSILLLLADCSSEDRKPSLQLADSPYELRDKGLQALSRQDPTEALKYADALLKIGESEKHPYFGIYGRIIKGQSYFLLDSAQLIYPYLHEAELLALEQHNDSALASVYNGLGIYTTNYLSDNNEALRYLFLGIDAAKRAGHNRLHSILLSNVATMYSMANDRSALRYAIECYDHGRESNDVTLEYIGAVNIASAYLSNGTFDRALEYIRKAEMLLHTNDIHNYSNLYTTYGLICQALNDPQEAEAYFSQAINPPDNSPIDLRSYINLAKIAANKKEYDKSLSYLNEALKHCADTKEAISKIEILHQFALTYKAMGNNAMAMEYEAKSRKVKEEQSNLNTNQTITQLKAQYDIERAENEVIRQKSEILEQKIEIWILASIAFLAIVCIVFVVILYKRRIKMYSAIVRQATESAWHEEALLSTISDLERQIPAPKLLSAPKETELTEELSEADASSDLDEKSLALLARFDALMADPKIYSDNLMTKERVAKLLGTNRTYISSIVNRRYKMSFTEYINRLRIQEAIRILSDPSNQDSLKSISESIGYNSTTTFYSKFKEVTGLTPASFRKQAKRME